MVENSLTATQNVGAIAVELKKRNISGQTWNVLKQTIFPDAQDQSILMAVDYCKVRNLDILKKPVHIVPMWSEKQKRLIDTVWQGISELRTTATRTGQYAGIDETVYGEEVTEEVNGVLMTFPKYAQVTVYRLVGGVRVPFVGDRVFWLENYSKKKDGSPNAMWKQRPFGQIGKCAEAAALRKAFPEEIGNTYTAEEMEGKVMEIDIVPSEPMRHEEPVQEKVIEAEIAEDTPDPLNNFD